MDVAAKMAALLRWTANAEATAMKMVEQGAEVSARYYLELSDRYRAQYRALASHG